MRYRVTITTVRDFCYNIEAPSEAEAALKVGILLGEKGANAGWKRSQTLEIHEASDAEWAE